VGINTTITTTTTIFSRIYPAYVYNLHKIAFSTQKDLYSSHRRIHHTGAANACHPSRPWITHGTVICHATAADDMGEGEVERSIAE